MNEENELPETEIDKELEDLSNRAGEFIAKCEARNCFDGFGELKSRAEREGRALYYIHGTFFQMTQASSLLDFNTTRERAIKLISILQRPEECFKIQPDFSEELYDFLVHDLSSCVYENLADAAGQMEGFNSKGLHDSIAGGIQVCRNTGKLGCIQCFREYAGDVYLAADDAELARHQCQTVIEHKGKWQSRGNRRWLATMKLGWIEVLQGDFELAQQRLENALELTDEEEVNVPLHAKFDVLIQLDAVRLIRGFDPLLDSHEIFSQLPPRDQSPVFDLMLDQNKALQAASQSDFDKADEILTRWDARLHRLQALHLWFENRLRLLALRRLNGGNQSIDTLAKTLEEKANEADDWLTLRRLGEVLGSDADPTLLAVRQSATRSQAVSLSQQVAPGKDDDEDSESGDQPLSPFGDEEPLMIEKLNGIVEKMKASYEERSEDGLEEVLQDLLDITPEESSTNSDTCGVLNIMSMLITPLFAERFDEIWKWANRLATPFRENGVVLSLLATIGNEIRLAGNDPEDGNILASRIEQLFRKSLELEKNGPQTYARAGTFFLEQEDVGEAEKCFARGFNLDRNAANIALKLAEVYNMTDRPRDALHVLDLCLREGTESDAVAWEAMLSSFQQRQFERMLNYLNRYEELVGEVSPVNYYRGVAFLELSRAGEALESIRKEKEFCDPDKDFHCTVVEYCALVELGEGSNHSGLAEKCVSTSLRSLEYIPMADILYLFELLWQTLRKEKPDSSILEELESKMLSAGAMPDAYFDELRSTVDPQDNIKFFRVLVNQKLDEDWPNHEGCLLGQEEWQNYFCEWGVLATSENDARERVLEIQARCYSGYAEVAEVIEDDQLFVDTPGVVWQGGRYSIPEDLDLDEDFDEDFDDDEPDDGLHPFDDEDSDDDDF